MCFFPLICCLLFSLYLYIFPYIIFSYIFFLIYFPQILTPSHLLKFSFFWQAWTSGRSLFPWHFGGGGLYIYILIYIFLCIFSYIYFLIYIFLYIFSYIYFPQILTPLSPVGRPGHPDAVCFLGTLGGVDYIYIFSYIFSYVYFLIYIFLYIFSYIYFLIYIFPRY